MAFPSVLGRNTVQAAANATASNDAIPSFSRGDLVLAFFGIDGNVPPFHGAAYAGWNTFDGLQQSGNAACRFAAYYRIADGSEGNLVIDFGATAGSSNENYCSEIVVIDDGTFDPNTPPAFGAAVSGGGADPNPPSLNPADWGTEDTLWLAVAAGDENVAFTAAPSGYSNGSNLLSTDGTTTNRAALGYAERQANAASEDPGTFTRAAEDSSAQTLAIRPFTAAHAQRISWCKTFYSTGTATVDVTVTILAGTDRRFAVFVGSERTGNISITSVTLDPAGVNTALTLCTDGTTSATQNQDSTALCAWYSLVDASLPAPGTYTLRVVVSTANEVTITAMQVENTDQRQNVRSAAVSGTTSGTSTTAAPTVGQNNSLVLSGCYKNNSATPLTSMVAAGLNMMPRGSCVFPTGGAHFVVAAKGLTTESGSQNVVETVPGAVRLSLVTIVLGPAVYVTGTGIVSLEGFGSATVSQAAGDQDVSPSSVSSLEAFGTSSLVHQLLANAIASAETFGTARLDRNISSAIKVAVIGSSTADGKNLEFDTPPADPATDKWPAVYAVHLATERPGSTVEFVTTPALNTYDAQATGSTPPGGRPSPNTSFNITKALSYGPDVVIASILSDLGKALTPTGSGGWNFSEAGLVTPGTGFIDAELIPNLQALDAECTSAGAVLYVATYQPRDSGLLDPNNPITAGEITAILYARDQILAALGPRALNFFVPLKAAGDNTIDDGLVLPDGLHPNKAGHVLLANVVVAADIPGDFPFLQVGTAEAFGTDMVQETVAPSGVSSLEAFGSSQLDRTLPSTGGATAEAFGTSALWLYVDPSGIGTAEALGAAVLSILNQIDPSGVASLEAFGDFGLNRTIAGGFVTTAEAFGDQVVGVPILASGVASLEAFGSHQLDGTLPATAVSSGEAFGAALLSLFVSPSEVASLESFGAPAAWLGIAPTGIASLGAFGSAELQQGDPTISPSGIASAEAFGVTAMTGILRSLHPFVGSAVKEPGRPTITSWTKA